MVPGIDEVGAHLGRGRAGGRPAAGRRPAPWRRWSCPLPSGSRRSPAGDREPGWTCHQAARPIVVRRLGYLVRRWRWTRASRSGRRTRRRPHRNAAPTGEGLLLVAHGSECVRSAEEIDALAARVGRRPARGRGRGRVPGDDRSARRGAQADRLVARGCRRVVVLPLVLLDAGHAKSDVPAVVVEARDRHPHVAFPFGRPIGVTAGAGRGARQGGGGVGRGRAAVADDRPRHVGSRRQRGRLQGRSTGRRVDGRPFRPCRVQRRDRPVASVRRPTCSTDSGIAA